MNGPGDDRPADNNMARKTSLAEPFDFLKPTIDDRGNSVWTVQFTARQLRTGERGRHTWPRVTSLRGLNCVACKARVWRGGPEYANSPTAIAVTFNPSAAAVAGTPVAFSDIRHILEAAGLKWSAGGAPRGSRRLFSDKIAYLEAVADFTARAKKERWAITDPRRFSPEIIASYIGANGITVRQMYIQNRDAELGMADIRNSRITRSYVQVRRAKL